MVRALLDRPRRYSDLAAEVAGIAPNTLADRLKRLERDGLLLARPYCARPPRYEYELTADGRDLGAAIDALTAWGARHADEPDDEPPVRV